MIEFFLGIDPQLALHVYSWGVLPAFTLGIAQYIHRDGFRDMLDVMAMFVMALVQGLFWPIWLGVVVWLVVLRLARRVGLPAIPMLRRDLAS